MFTILKYSVHSRVRAGTSHLNCSCVHSGHTSTSNATPTQTTSSLLEFTNIYLSFFTDNNKSNLASTLG